MRVVDLLGPIYLSAPPVSAADRPAGCGDAGTHGAGRLPGAAGRGSVVHIVPCMLGEAAEFVANFHRHNRPPVGGLFACGASDGARLIGVGIVGRPVSRHMQDGMTAEVTRCCVRDGAPKGTPSALYGALWRAARALGWRRLITYTLRSESGASLRGAGWRVVAERAPSDPARWQSRPGREWQPVVGQAKLLWSAEMPGGAASPRVSSLKLAGPVRSDAARTGTFSGGAA